MEIHKTEGLKITVLGNNDESWLLEQLQPLIDSGKITYVNTDEHPEIFEQTGLPREEFDRPVAIISVGDEDTGSYCVISQIGESIIAHCEDKVIPLR